MLEPSMVWAYSSTALLVASRPPETNNDQWVAKTLHQARRRRWKFTGGTNRGQNQGSLPDDAIGSARGKSEFAFD